MVVIHPWDLLSYTIVVFVFVGEMRGGVPTLLLALEFHPLPSKGPAREADAFSASASTLTQCQPRSLFTKKHGHRPKICRMHMEAKSPPSPHAHSRGAGTSLIRYLEASTAAHCLLLASPCPRPQSPAGQQEPQSTFFPTSVLPSNTWTWKLLPSTAS